MSDASPPQPPRRRSVRLRVAAIAAGVLLAIVVIINLPVFRSIVLRYALRTIESRYGVHAEVRELDYNLATLHVALTGVRASRPGSPSPFFEADRVSASFPFRILFGAFSIDTVAIDKGLARVLVNADGTSNLPAAVAGENREPAALPVGRFDAPGFAIDFRDEGRGLRVRVPGLSLHVERDSGRLASDAPIEITAGRIATAIARLESGVAFDGRDLKIRDLQLRHDAVGIRGGGVVALLRQNQSLDINASGEIDTAAASRLFDVPDGPRGTVTFTVRATGALAAPVADVNVASPDLTWRQLSLREIAAHLRASADAVTVDKARASFSGGQLNADASIALGAAQPGRVNVSWSEIDAQSLAAAALPSATIAPAGRVSGELHGTGPAADWRAWQLDGRLTFSEATTGRGQIALPGESQIRLADRIWRVDLRHRVAAVAPITGTLTVRLTDAAPDTWPIEGTLDLQATDATRLLRTLHAIDPAVPADALTRGTIRATTTIGGTIGAPRAAFTAHGDSFEAAGQEVATIDAAGRWDGTLVRVTTLSAAQRDGAGRVSGSASYAVSSGTYRADLTANGWTLRPADDLPVAGSVDARLSATGRGAAAVADADVTLRSAEVRGIRLGDIATRAHVEDNRARFSTQVPELNVTADGVVGLREPYTATINAASPRLDLARALRDIATPTPIEGTAALRLDATGTLAAWRDGQANIAIESLDARAGGVGVRLSSPAAVRYSGQRIVIDRLDAEAGTTRIAASGSLAAFASGAAATGSDGIVVTGVGDLGEAIEAAEAAGLVQAPIDRASGPFALLARATGSLESPVLTADLEVGPGEVTVRSDLPPVSDVRVRVHVEEDDITLRELAAQYQGAKLTADGRIPVALVTGASSPGRPASIHAKATGLTPAALRPFVDDATIEQLDGGVEATLDLTSTGTQLETIQGEARLDRFDLSLAGLKVRQAVPTRIGFANGFARVDAWQWQGDGGTLSVQGQVRLRDRQAAILANGNLDLRILTPFVRDAGLTTSGMLAPRLSVTGPIDAPRIDGDISMTSGEVRLNEPRVIVTDLNARAVLSRTAAHLTSIEGTINGGTLRGAGDLSYAFGSGAGSAPQVDARLTTAIAGMALEFPEGLRSELNADLDVSVTGLVSPMPSGRIAGTVTLVRGAYRQQLPIVTSLLTSLKQRRATALFESSPLLDALALDVRIVTDDDLVVGNNVARLQLGADLRVIGTAAAPAISGRADLRAGGELFLGRNVYTLQLGTINFANPTAIDPDVNVTATTRAGGQAIEITMSGTPETMSAELRSTTEPTLGQADIASLLLTGRRLDELDTRQASAIGTQLLGNLSGDVLGFASRAVGLDMLRIGGVDTGTRRDPSAVATEVDPTSRLTFGKSIGEKVDVTFSQSLRDADAQTWIVDYLSSRQLALRFVSGDDDLRSYELRHDFSLGAPPKPPALSITPVVAGTEPPRVTAIAFEGQLLLPEKELRDRLRLTAGKRFDFSEWQDDRDRLQQLYRGRSHLAAQIKATRREAADGIQLVYAIDAGPETRIEVTGAELDPPVIQSIESAWSDSAFDGFLIDEARDLVTRGMAARGYLQSKVTAALRNEPGVRTLAIDVTPGPRTDRTTIRLTVDEESLRGELESAIAASGVESAAVANPASVVQMISDVLRSQGYTRARVRAGAPLFEDATAVVPVSVESGPRLVIGSIAFTGAGTLSQDVLRDTAALAPGTPFSDVAVEEARARLQALYRREAFSAARVTTSARAQTDAASANAAPPRPAIDVTFAVVEGPRQVVGEVAVAGNRSTDTDVITRALDLETGQPLRAEDFLRARRQVFDMGLFRRVDVTTEALPPGSETTTAPMRVRVTVEEWPALRVRYGLQVAEERPEDNPRGRDLVPGFSADLTRQTLFGRAMTTGGALVYQQRERSGRAFLNAPTFLGAPIQSSFVVKGSREEFAAATLVTAVRGLSWEQRLRKSNRLSLSYTYSFERNHTFDTEAVPGSEFAFDVTVNIARLTAAAAWDTRDDVADPTRGSLFSVTFEDAPEVLGSGIRYVRQLAQAYTFRPWRGMVLASAARFGVVQPLGDQELIPSVRFFAGGARTVRGFTEDALGPRDVFGDPAGGEALLVLNQELRFPVHKWLKGVAFVDAGNVFVSPSELSLSALRTAAGLGLRLATPVALLRVDYGQRLNGAPLSRGGQWFFGIGQSF